MVLLEDVIVRAGMRGPGPGRRLAEHVLDWARAIGARWVALLTDADNAAVQVFYQRLGFQPSAMRVLRRIVPQIADPQP